MSHFRKVKLQISDRKALMDAVKSMGLDLKHNIPCRPGNTVYPDVIQMPGRYDCGIIKDDDSCYILVYPPYTTAERILGKDGALLRKSYVEAKLKAEAQKINFRCVSRGDKFVLFNPQDTKKQLEVDFTSDEIIMHARGFSGSGCMIFHELEVALGSVIEEQYTSEYYSTNQEEETHLKHQS